MEEIWKDIDGYIGLYQVSNLGRIKSLARIVNHSRSNGTYIRTEKILKAGDNNNGYPSVSLHKDGKRKLYLVHRLVAIAFIANPENKCDVNHINGIKSDNNLSNLEWNTRRENIQHAYDTRLRIPVNGINHSSNKLTEQQVLEIRSSNLTHRELGKIYDVSQTTISRIKNRHIWKHI
jgi:hypothetical protein